MAASLEDDDLQEKDDYYAWLGLNINASQEDINSAFRRMSRLYHPDKHSASGNTRQAEELFTKIKRAHEVLSDPQLKAIYDTTGVKGLQTDGWQVVQRTKSPREILEEYRQLQAEKEERLLQRQTNPLGSLNVGLDLSRLFDSYSQSESLLGQTSISQSVLCPLTTKDTVTLAGSVSSDMKKGNGNIKATYRRLISNNSWAEGEVLLGSSTSALHLRGFRNLWSKAFGTLSGSIQIMSAEQSQIIPLASAVLVQQLNKHIQGRLTYTLSSVSSSVRTSVTWSNANQRLEAALQLGVPSMFVKLSYYHMLPEYDLSLNAKLKLGTLSMLGEYGCVKKLTQFSTVSASMAIGVPSGVNLHIRLQRGTQTFSFPVFLCDEITPEPVLYGTIVPLVIYAVVKVMLINPFIKSQKEKDLQLRKNVNAEWKAKKKQEAESALELMKESIDRSFEQEEKKGGLVIKKALYGKLEVATHGEGNIAVDESECINVTRPIQALVNQSKLILFEDTQLSELPGFYDPCVGEDKQLSITYSFRQQLHTCIYSDNEKIVIPNKSHLCEST